MILGAEKLPWLVGSPGYKGYNYQYQGHCGQKSYLRAPRALRIPQLAAYASTLDEVQSVREHLETEM